MDLENMWFFEKIMVKANMPQLEQKVSFFRLFAMTQSAWLGVRESLASIHWSESHPGMRRILEDLIEKINQWSGLSDALENHDYFFEISEIELIRSSEQMWNMQETLKNMAKELENFQKIKSKIKSAMTYPVMVLIFAWFAVVILLIKVLPVIIGMFPSMDKLPWITVFMMDASDFLKAQWYMVIFYIFTFIFTWKLLYARFLPFKILIDKVSIKMPIIWPLVFAFYHYRFSKLLWDFYEAWVSPNDALNQMANIFPNYHYKKKMQDVRKDIEWWLGFTDSLEWSWLFAMILIQIIWIWEKTGNIWWVLIQMADFYRDEMETTIEWLMKTIEPLLMAFIAVIIWGIVAAVFLPMAELMWTLWW